MDEIFDTLIIIGIVVIPLTILLSLITIFITVILKNTKKDYYNIGLFIISTLFYCSFFYNPLSILFCIFGILMFLYGNSPHVIFGSFVLIVPFLNYTLNI